MNRWKLVGLTAAAVATLVAAGPAARAQYRLDVNYCMSLQAQYQDALQRASDAGMTGQKMVQIDQIGQQLAQAQTAARRYGCTGGFLFFAPRPSPQCPAIMARVNQLSRQLSQLRGNSYFFFGTSPEAEVARLRDALNSNGCAVPMAGGTRTLCVRLCDGYYFPIEFDASSDRFDADAAACQSMYAQDGQAELFIQSGTDDPADATSLDTGQRYGDQPYAFEYRQSYAPACVAELHTGIKALAERYFALLPPSRKVAAAPSTPVPVPQLRQPSMEDPETLANAAGHFTIKPVAPAVALSNSPHRPVRMVGPAYYADMFDLSKERKKQESLRPTFSIVTPAAAAEGSNGDQAVADPAAPPPASN